MIFWCALNLINLKSDATQNKMSILQLNIHDRIANITDLNASGRVYACFLDVETHELLNVEPYKLVYWDCINSRIGLFDRLTVGSAFFVSTPNRELIAVLPIRAQSEYNVYWAIRGLLHLICNLSMTVQVVMPAAPAAATELNEVELAIDDHNQNNTAICDPDKTSVSIVEHNIPWAYLLTDDAK